MLQLRSSNRPTTSNSQQSHALWLGWNNRDADDQPATPAAFSIDLAESLAAEWGLGPQSRLDLMLAALDQKPGPREREGEEDEDDDSEEARSEGRDSEDEEDDEPVDLSVEVSDAAGNSARVLLSAYGPIRKPLEMAVRRRNDADSFANQWELVLQSYSIPLIDFTTANGALDVGSLRRVRLLFDQTEAGTVVIDDIGFSIGP